MLPHKDGRGALGDPGALQHLLLPRRSSMAPQPRGCSTCRRAAGGRGGGHLAQHVFVRQQRGAVEADARHLQARRPPQGAPCRAHCTIFSAAIRPAWSAQYDRRSVVGVLCSTHCDRRIVRSGHAIQHLGASTAERALPPARRAQAAGGMRGAAAPHHCLPAASLCSGGGNAQHMDRWGPRGQSA